jgi:hypothetical protein
LIWCCSAILAHGCEEADLPILITACEQSNTQPGTFPGRFTGYGLRRIPLLAVALSRAQALRPFKRRASQRSRRLYPGQRRPWFPRSR